MANSILEWLEETSKEPEYTPATAEELEARKQAANANTITIKFWKGEFTFTNEKDDPITGKVKGQSHQTKLLRRAMERARDEGKKLVAKNGMDTVRLERVTDQDIAIYCREY